MSKIAATHSKIYVGPYDLTTNYTNIGLTLSRAAIEANCMQDDAVGTAVFMQEWLHGMKSFEASYSGYTEAGTGKVNTVLNTYFGAANTIMTMCPLTGAAGEPAYSAYMTNHQHTELDGSVGGMAGFAGAAFGEGTPVFRGTILGTGAKVITGNSSIYQLGAISAGKAMYAALHVTAIVGDDTQSLNVKIYSDDAEAFTTPTERIAFSQVGQIIASEIESLTTAVTDTYWRATWTIANGGENVSFTIMLNAGIITL